MIDGTPRALTVVAAIGAAVSGGVFLAFSTFVMRALRRLPDRQGLTAMQQVNRAAPQPLFMLFLFGTAVVCVVLGISAGRRLDDREAVLQLIACATYLAGIVVTVAYHIPHNDALDAVDPAGADAGSRWQHWAAAWTAWNHVRTLTCIAAATLLTLALRVE